MQVEFYINDILKKLRIHQRLGRHETQSSILQIDFQTLIHKIRIPLVINNRNT